MILKRFSCNDLDDIGRLCRRRFDAGECSIRKASHFMHIIVHKPISFLDEHGIWLLANAFHALVLASVHSEHNNERAEATIRFNGQRSKRAAEPCSCSLLFSISRSLN